MHASQLLLALTSLCATASATRIAIYLDDKCGRAYMYCSDIGSHECCQFPAFFDITVVAPSIEFKYIMSTDDITVQAHSDRECKNTRATEPSKGRGTICLRQGPFRSGSYYVNHAPALEMAEKPPCREPDAVGLPDGTVFDLNGLTGEDYQNMVEIAFNATTAADMPAAYLKRQKSD